MLTIRRHPVLASLLVAGVLALVADRVLAQNATVKGKGKPSSGIHQTGTIAAMSQASIDADVADESSTLVPVKMTMIITDIIVSNAAASAASFQVLQAVLESAPQTHMVEVGANSTFAYNFGTGLEFPAGSRMNIFATGQQLTYTVTGYLRKS